MSLRDHTHLLERLIIAGERAVMARSSPDPDALARLCSEVLAEVERPTDARRVMSDHTTIVVQSLLLTDAALRRYDATVAARYARVIGVLLPDIRADLLTAIENRRRPTP